MALLPKMAFELTHCGCIRGGRSFARHQCRARLPRARWRSRHCQPLHAADHGDHRLWCLGAGGRRWVDRRRATALIWPKRLTSTPDAAHAGHDHRAAGPVFLHIGRVAHPDGVRAREIPRVNALGFRLIAGIDAKPRRRPSNGRLDGALVGRGLGRLRGPRPLWRSLRPGTGREQRKHACKGHRYCQSPDTHRDAHPNPLPALRSPIAAAASTAGRTHFRQAPLPGRVAWAGSAANASVRFRGNRFPFFRIML